MPRQPRQLLPGYSYHVTCRCNNREFRLTRLECRQVFLYAIKKALDKFGFKLYALCIMSNHVHYLLEPTQPEDLPKIMHWLNWYTAMYPPTDRFPPYQGGLGGIALGIFGRKGITARGLRRLTKNEL